MTSPKVVGSSAPTQFCSSFATAHNKTSFDGLSAAEIIRRTERQCRCSLYCTLPTLHMEYYLFSFVHGISQFLKKQTKYAKKVSEALKDVLWQNKAEEACKRIITPHHFVKSTVHDEPTQVIAQTTSIVFNHSVRSAHAMPLLWKSCIGPCSKSSLANTDPLLSSKYS